MRYPKDIGVWEHAPGRKLAEVVVKVKNEKGALAQCSRIVSDLDVNMLSGYVSAPSDSEAATWSFYADLTDSKYELADLKRSLQGNPLVQSVETRASEDGFMVDMGHFPVLWSGRRVLVMRAEAMNEMLFRLWSVFGSGAAAIIDQMAEAMGRQSATEVLKDFGKEFAQKHMEELLTAYGALGYAEIKLERSKTAEYPLIIHAKCLFECQANAARNLRRKSVFFRAHLRGFMSGLFDDQFDVVEVQCRSAGDDVCSFHVTVSEEQVPELSWRAPHRNGHATYPSNF